MKTTLEAIYEQGVLRLLQPLPLAEGSRVEVTISATEFPIENKTPAEILSTIAAMPLEAGGEEFSGREHDKILYGEKGAR